MSNRPQQPLAEAPTAPRLPSIDDLPDAIGELSRNQDRLIGLADQTVDLAGTHSSDRPPPDRQALLCVWTI
ncbi:MAG: hypothetical protein AAF266_03660 [Planctomycetota bacterium]